MARIWKRLAADEELADEFKLAVRELRVEVSALRTELYVLRQELQVIADGTTSRRLERLRQHLRVALNLNLDEV